MNIEISDSKIVVEYDNEEYVFERYKDREKTLDPKEDKDLPREVVEELEGMNFFVRDYPKEFVWDLGEFNYSYDDILVDLPEGTIEEDSLAHKSLYNLLCDDSGAIRVKIRVNKNGYCEIVDVVSDLPVKGSVRKRNR